MRIKGDIMDPNMKLWGDMLTTKQGVRYSKEIIAIGRKTLKGDSPWVTTPKDARK